jgi:hypothetical protein
MAYMAGVFESRHDRENRSVFGMLSDSRLFWFAHLDYNKKLYVSEPYTWASRQSTILAYIDTILLDAIKSSPHTTPTKVGNTSLQNYPRYLKEQWKFGEESEIEEGEDDYEKTVVVDIIKDQQGQFVLVRRGIDKECEEGS